MTNDDDIREYSTAELDALIAAGHFKTDWAQVDAMTDEEREAAIDVEEEGEFDEDSTSTYTIWDGETISIRLDTSTIEWFREAVAGTGYGYKTRIAEVLRAYVAEQRALAANAGDDAPPPPSAAPSAPATDLRSADAPLRRAG